MTQSSGEDDADFQLALKLQAEMNAADADVSGDESVGNEGVSIFALDMSKTGNNNNKKHSNKKPPPRVSIKYISISYYTAAYAHLMLYSASRVRSL